MSVERLLGSAEARKVFGRKELGIIRRQLDGLPLTRSERNRLSRDIRPKCRFMAAFAACGEDPALRKGQAAKRAVRESLEAIRADEVFGHVLAVVLFGSFADGSQTLRSDIDIGLVLDRTPSVAEATLLRKRLLGRLPTRADLQVVNVLPAEVRASIASSHRVLYRRSAFDDALFTRWALAERGEHARRRGLEP